jgi:hypothetical protein
MTRLLLLFALPACLTLLPAPPAQAQLPVAGTWVLDGQIRVRECSGSGRCMPVSTMQYTSAIQIDSNHLPTPGPLVPCQPEAGQLPQLVRYARRGANSRQYTLKVLDRPALVSLYTACSDSSFRLGPMFSRIKLSVDGEHSTQRDRLKYSRVAEGRRVFVTVTARLTGALTSVSAPQATGGERPAGQFEAAAR